MILKKMIRSEAFNLKHLLQKAELLYPSQSKYNEENRI